MRFRLLVSALVAVLALSALAASSAMAEEGSWERFTGTFKYTGGPGFTITSTAMNMSVDGFAITCHESTWSGTAAASGTSNANDAVLALFEMASWDKGADECESPIGKFRVSTELLALHWNLRILWRLIKEPKTHFLGLISKFDATWGTSGCEFLIGGSVPVLVRVLRGKPSLELRLNSTVNSNDAGETNNLLISKITESGGLGCAGIKEGDKPVLDEEHMVEGIEEVALE